MAEDTTYGTNGNDILSGGNGKDTIYGLDGDDIISGGNGVDNLFGGEGNDQLTGDNGADNLTGGGDDDIIDGLSGFDTAYYSGNIEEYNFLFAAGYLHIIHNGGAGADGHDQVRNVERLVFADRVIEIGSGTNRPVASDDAVFINEDTGTYNSGAASVLDDDFDFDGDPLTVTAGTFTGTYGTLTLNSDGTYSYTLFASVQGLDDGEVVQDSFNYTVSDNDGSDTGALVFHIAGLNDAPVANDDTNTTDEDTAATGNVLANDTDVDVEPLVVANPGTYVGTYGTLVLAADGSYTYSPNAAAQALDDGEVVQDAFNYTASDGTASDTATLTVTVNGVNDAPVANDDTANTTEETAVSGNVLTNDTDVDGEALTVANPGTYVGTYGTLILAADGSYTYTPGAAAQGLDTGEIGQDVFIYTASDGTASDTANLTVNVAGLNDAPVAVDDTNTTDENTAVSGNVLTNDTDVDGETLTVANPATYIGAYGTLVLAANGSYTYTPSGAAALLDQGETADDVFNYVVSDGTAADAGILTITVTGLSGAPDAVDDTATTTEDAPVSGNVLTNDTDVENDPLSVSNPGSYTGSYGTLNLAADGSYTYTPSAAADALAVGETADDVFNYTATDGTASDSATLTVTLTGLNDAPTIDAGNTDASGAVTELPDGDPNEGVTVHTDSGAVAFNDLDVSDTHSASFTPQGAFYLGTFSLDPVDQPGDSVGWDFSVSDAALEGLSEGEVRIQTYSVQVSDGHGGTASQNVTITITGAGIGVGPQTVWFIDNSAVGSANLGTSADPYTSIAAFNAAQGSLGGPQAGHTVRLLAGTGTGVYAEADGINLLNGQILVGDATGPIRPTIEATSGDGINVAQDNNVSGIDIGNTSGADIADSGGTVGNLVISDVGTSGTGQIIDIDQGGTLNVTLNEAGSTGSSGGAIDLNTVSGTFTVTGPTSIAGAHSGGAVDITGGTLVTAFQGDLTIATTSGFGLNVANSGEITVTGGTILTTGATALAVTGTTISATGITLESVSSTGGVNGIVLQSTGALGGLTVTGTGVAGSGGTLAGSSGAAIVANDTMDLSLTSIGIVNPAGQAILATNLRGESSVTDSTISGFGSDGIRISNTNTDMTSFTVTNTTFAGPAGNDAIFMEALGTSDMGLLVQGSTFTGLTGDAIQVIGSTTSSGVVELHVVDSDFLNAAVGGNGGVVVNSLGTMTTRALVEDSTFDGVMRALSTLGAVTLSNGGSATAHFTVLNNVIEDLPGGRGVTFSADAGTSYLMIDGNTIDRLGSTSRPAVSATLTGTAVGDVIVSNNDIGQNGNLWTAGTGTANAIAVTTQNSAQLDLLIDANAIDANTGVEAVRIRAINTSLMNATITNNDLTDTAGTHVEFDATDGLTTGTSVINLDIHDNIMAGGATGVLRLSDLAGGALNVTQASLADVSIENNGVTVTQTGTVTYGAPPPPLPDMPDWPLFI